MRGLPVQYEVVPAVFIDSYEHRDIPFSNGNQQVSFYIYEFEYPENYGTTKHNSQILDIVKKHADERKNDFSVYIFQQQPQKGYGSKEERYEQNGKPEIQIDEDYSIPRPMEDQSEYNNDYPAIDIRFGSFDKFPPAFGDPQDSPMTSHNEYPVTSPQKKPLPYLPSFGAAGGAGFSSGGFGAIGGPGNFPQRNNKGKDIIEFE